jgi:hypothetical protein
LLGLPIDVTGIGPQLDAQPLQRLIEFPYSLLFVDALIALEPFDACAGSLGNRIRELRLAAARWTFE